MSAIIAAASTRSSCKPVRVGPSIGWWRRSTASSQSLRWLARTCEVIPVNRGGIDTRATKLAIRLASRGEMVGMLPEGRINKTRRIHVAGASGRCPRRTAARVPILPCYIEGAPYAGTEWSPFLMPARVRVVIGQRIDLSEYYDRVERGRTCPATGAAHRPRNRSACRPRGLRTQTSRPPLEDRRRSRR